MAMTDADQKINDADGVILSIVSFGELANAIRGKQRVVSRLIRGGGYLPTHLCKLTHLARSACTAHLGVPSGCTILQLRREVGF